MKKTLIIISAISLFACKAAADSTTQKQSAATTETTATVNKQELKPDLTLQFISKGAGIDNDLHNKFKGALARFNKENGTNLEPVKKHWGREGEFDLHFSFKNLSTSQQKKFNNLINNTIGETDMVHIKRN